MLKRIEWKLSIINYCKLQKRKKKRKEEEKTECDKTR